MCSDEIFDNVFRILRLGAVSLSSLLWHSRMCSDNIIVLTIVCVLGTESLSYNRHRKNRKKHYVGCTRIKLLAELSADIW